MSKFVLLIPMIVWGGCKSTQETANLKDDILIKNDDKAVLYWLASDGEEQHVCRAICDEKNIKVNGDLAETRKSCDISKASSIPAKLFSEKPELAALYKVFSMNLDPNKVSVLDTSGKQGTNKEKNIERIRIITDLFSDENMYLDAKTRAQRDAGLYGFGEEFVKRFHPSCLAPNTAKTGATATNVGEDVGQDIKVLKRPKIEQENGKIVILPEAAYEVFYAYLRMQSEHSPDEQRNNYYSLSAPYKINTTAPSSDPAIWTVYENKSVKFDLSGNRAPIMMSTDGSFEDDTKTLSDPESNNAWNQFAKAIYKRLQAEPGPEIVVEKTDLSKKTFSVTVSTTENTSFSSPGDRLANKFYISMFADKKNPIHTFGIQFNVFEDQKDVNEN